MSICSTKQHQEETYLESDVIIPNSNLQLLLAYDILLGPVSVILPVQSKR